MRTAYITGSPDREQLEVLRDAMKEQPYTPVTPYDLIDDMEEQEAMRTRLRAVLDADVIVTTGPNQGAWSEAARREVALARLANIEVIPGVTITQQQA